MLGRPVGLLQAAAGDADVGLAVHELNERLQAPPGGRSCRGSAAGRSAAGRPTAKAGRIAALLPNAKPPFRSRGRMVAQSPQPSSRIAAVEAFDRVIARGVVGDDHAASRQSADLGL